MALPAPTDRLSRLALLVLAATTLISVMNASMSSIVLPGMRREFEVGPDALSWVVAAYLIPFATGTVIYGRLADMYGSRRLYILGLSIFAAGSIAVATAPSFAIVIAMRAAQGIGGTAIPALGVATILRFTPGHRRGSALGVLVLAVGVGFALGPLLGGVLTDAIGWQGPFLFTGIASALLIPAALRWVPGFPGTLGQRLDWLGGVLVVGAVTGAVIALNRLPRDPADPLGLGGLALAVPLTILLAVRMAVATEPFIPPKLLRTGRFSQMSLVGFTSQGCHFGAIVLLPLLLEEFHQLPIIQIGLRLMPGALALGFFGVLGGRLANRLGERVLLIVGTWLMFSGAIVFHLTGVDFSTWNVGFVYLLIAAGYGMVNAAVLKAATDPLPDAMAGIGTGVFNLAFFIGGAMAVALVGAILRTRVDATAAWDPAFDGVAIAYSDAMLVLVGFALVGFLVTVIMPPSRKATEPAYNPASEWLPMTQFDLPIPGPAAWANKPRAKPNTLQPRSAGTTAAISPRNRTGRQRSNR